MNITEIYEHKIYERYNDLKLSGKEFFDNTDLCKIFEYYTCIKLTKELNQPFYEYNDIDANFKELHQMSKNDTGIDCCNLIDTIVQCKLRKNSLTWSEVSTFFGSNLSFCDEQKKLMVAWPNLIISRNADSSLSQNLKVKSNLFTDKIYDKIEIVKYCEELLVNPPQLMKEKSEIRLRDYQIEAIDLIKNSGNIVICLPTGTGKNIIIINSLEKDQKYLILVPLRLLMEQMKHEIIKHSNFNEKDIQFIGDGNKTFDSKKSITICVYNSINLVENYNQFTKIFVDEAHHINKPLIYNDDENNDDDEDTESYIYIIQKLSKHNNNVYLSATIDEIDGFSYYKKDMRDMINNGYLCDYTINIPVFGNDPSNKNICQYLIQNYRNIIIYCGTTKEGKAINDMLNLLHPNSSAYIDCKTSKKNRLTILTKYKNGNIPFLVNVRILCEGYDSPITRGVVFMHMPSTKTMLIQIMGRCLRFHPLKKYANIILPYSIDADIKSISTFLKIMALNDDKIKKSYKNKKFGGYINIDQIDTENDTELKYELIYNHIGELIEENWNTKEEKWIYHLNKVKEYEEIYGIFPRKKTYYGTWIHRQKQHKNIKGGHIIKDNPEINKRWFEFSTDDKYKKYFNIVSSEANWINRMNDVYSYVKMYDQLPTKRHNDPTTQSLGTWLNQQRQLYKTKKKSMKNPNIIKRWEEFLLFKHNNDLYYPNQKKINPSTLYGSNK